MTVSHSLKHTWTSTISKTYKRTFKFPQTHACRSSFSQAYTWAFIVLKHVHGFAQVQVHSLQQTRGLSQSSSMCMELYRCRYSPSSKTRGLSQPSRLCMGLYGLSSTGLYSLSSTSVGLSKSFKRRCRETPEPRQPRRRSDGPCIANNCRNACLHPACRSTCRPMALQFAPPGPPPQPCAGPGRASPASQAVTASASPQPPPSSLPSSLPSCMLTLSADVSRSRQEDDNVEAQVTAKLEH